MVEEEYAIGALLILEYGHSTFTYVQRQHQHGTTTVEMLQEQLAGKPVTRREARLVAAKGERLKTGSPTREGQASM